jgi:hypothetical protein
MYRATVNELKAVLKVSAQTGRSGAENKTTLESMALDDDFRRVKTRKRPISNDASQMARKLTKSVPISAAVKLTPQAMLTGRCSHL